MSVLLKIVGFANGADCPIEGQYLKTFDFEAYSGQGFGTFTRDKSDAMKFKDAGAALQFWKRRSTLFTTRKDGKPNRPLTACSAEFEQFDEAHVA